MNEKNKRYNWYTCYFTFSSPINVSQWDEISWIRLYEENLKFCVWIKKVKILDF